MIPVEVAAAWGWEAAAIEPLLGGLINTTYSVRVDGAPVAVVQRLHSIFAPSVNLDIEAVTAHLAARSMPTPRLVRTRDGQAWCEHAGRIWRALSWVDGLTVHKVTGVDWARAGGELVGRFHRAIVDCDHTYAFARLGVHDTAAHLERLRGHVEGGGDREAIDLGREILDAASALPPMPATPDRHCHGDLKISNLMFVVPPSSPVRGAPWPVRGHCLVDLDTLGMGTMAFELGDAMRSWCNPLGEDAGSVTFDLGIFEAAIGGFRSAADEILSRDERVSIVVGLETVCIELAARFAVDVFRDEYFGWDAMRFPSRRAHNLIRARGQLALGLAVRGGRQDALAIVQAGA